MSYDVSSKLQPKKSFEKVPFPFHQMAVNVTKLIFELLNSIEYRDELKQSLKILNVHVSSTLDDCIEECFNLKKKLAENYMFKINSIIDFVDDEMNIGHWSNISVELRRVYYAASFIRALFYLKTNESNMNVNILRETLKYVDKGLLMGAPLEKNSELLTKVATILTTYIGQYSNEKCIHLEKDNNDIKQYEFLYQSIKAREVDIVVIPSLQQFNNLYFMVQHPVKIQGCIDHWPARKKWKHLEYILQRGGDRTVPVEIGTQYVDENWSQELMTVREFIEKYYLNKNGEKSIGYLAQHNLFDQIPELREDICIPEYCSLSQDYDKSCDPDINCWFGPAGTVSSLHFDPKNNLLAQVYGTKQILLFPPHDSQYLHPFKDTMLNNTSQIDPLIPDLTLYPNFSNTTMYKCLLNEGEMLYIPEKWWHHVIALEKSFSVSFWWQ